MYVYLCVLFYLNVYQSTISSNLSLFHSTHVFHPDSPCQCRQLHGGNRRGGKKKQIKRRRLYKSDIYNFAKLFSNNPVKFDTSLCALAKNKCDKDCNGQSVMKSLAKSSRSHRRRSLFWLKKNAMRMQMAKRKRTRVDRAQDVKVRIPCTL